MFVIQQRLIEVLVRCTECQRNVHKRIVCERAKNTVNKSISRCFIITVYISIIAYSRLPGTFPPPLLSPSSSPSVRFTANLLFSYTCTYTHAQAQHNTRYSKSNNSKNDDDDDVDKKKPVQTQCEPWHKAPKDSWCIWHKSIYTLYQPKKTVDVPWRWLCVIFGFPTDISDAHSAGHRMPST